MPQVIQSNRYRTTDGKATWEVTTGPDGTGMQAHCRVCHAHGHVQHTILTHEVARWINRHWDASPECERTTVAALRDDA